MKNKFLYISAVSLFMTLGCKKQLTSESIGLLTQEQANTTPTLTTVETSVKSSYKMLANTLNMLGSWDWAGGLVFQNDVVISDIESDDMEKKWASDGDQPWMDDINNFTFTASNGGPNGLWKYDYEGIKRVNIALGYLTKTDIEQVTGISTDRKNQLLGECYFLRAYYYFSLVTNFGDVPLITKTVESYQEAFKVAVRTSKDSVWNQIKTDLTAAKPLLPNAKFSSSTEPWRVSKGAVIALQAKAALYTQQWNDVITLINELESTNFYSLNENYFSSFNTEFTDKEVIFAYDHTSKQIPQNGNGYCAPLGWGFFAPSANFMASFEPNDPRALYTVDVSGQNVNKLLGTLDGTNKGNDDADNNKILIRYADVLLWKAEAYLETGDLANAVSYINTIRARARTTVTADGSPVPAGTLANRPASTDKTVVKNWLIAERRAELGFENERMPDLKRWGIAKEVMTALGKNFQDKHYLYPVPQSEIDASAGTLTQNPGY
ncbi:MAG: RagB/SusD family nutrient uptake outer membrane protein [Chitinophagaceae bacterium]|nr:RagB/SusD family nutrient uptake outer membrane protein [Chitinophagaceae bacterium]